MGQTPSANDVYFYGQGNNCDCADYVYLKADQDAPPFVLESGIGVDNWEQFVGTFNAHMREGWPFKITLSVSIVLFVCLVVASFFVEVPGLMSFCALVVVGVLFWRIYSTLGRLRDFVQEQNQLLFIPHGWFGRTKMCYYNGEPRFIVFSPIGGQHEGGAGHAGRPSSGRNVDGFGMNSSAS